MIMIKYIVLVYLIFLFYVGANIIFDDYAGPYQQQPMGSEYCRITGRSCLECNFTRRKLPGPENDWFYNVSIRSYFYMKESTTVRIVATTKGASGHFNSLADITRPVCKWIEWIKPFINDLAEHSGYNPEGICLATYPGLFTVTNFHLKAQNHFRLVKYIPIAPYGLYKFEIRLSEKDNPNCHCIRVFMNIIPDVKAIIRNQRQNRTNTRMGLLEP